MRNIFVLALLIMAATFTATAQQLTGGPLTVVSSNMTSTGGSAVYTRTATVTNGGNDTCTLKLQGGNGSSLIHFWNVATKTSGTTDSMVISIWANVKSSTAGTNASYKLLYSDQTANTTGEQVFEHLLTGNGYTDYMMTVRRTGTSAQVSTYKYNVLLR